MVRPSRKGCLSLGQRGGLADTRCDQFVILVRSRRGEVGMTARLNEKRNEHRVRNALPVSVDSASGVMRDMSASGAHFWVSGADAIGDTIQLFDRT